MNIKQMSLKDFEEIFSLWEKVELNLESKQKQFREYKSILKYNPDSCFILLHDSKIIGTIMGTYNGRRAWIYHLAIDPKYQKKGLGSKLLEHVERILIKKKAVKVVLGVDITNLEVTKFYYKNNYQVMNDAIYMEKYLVS